MGLFHIQEEAVGSVFWHPKGWKLYRTVESYMRRRLDAADYQEVKTPQLVDRALWIASGHWEKFREHMFIALVPPLRAIRRAARHHAGAGIHPGRRAYLLH
jgi:threonyl-tRNA synthetase